MSAPDIYSKIREENRTKYGTDISRYGPVLLANLYSDKTHFLYELLQNAEDACERRSKSGKSKEYKIHFELFQDRLEVRHNGIAFDEKDVRGICGIVEGTKNNDFSQIGKFGIGFKSVYAYTKSPKISSGNWHFSIRDYVFPYPEEPVSNLGDETLFIIPFNKDDQDPYCAFNDIKEKLPKLGLEVLLFINNISEISWGIGSRKGKYTRNSVQRGRATKIILQYAENGSLLEKREFLVFKKKLRDPQGNDRDIAIAYRLSWDEKKGQEIILPQKESCKLFVYFSTEKETHLKFLIQGPYSTTPNRDNIRRDDYWNNMLIKETANLVAESIIEIKNMGILNVDFLNTLPTEISFKHYETTFFPIYDAVKDFLRSHPLLPAFNGSYVEADKAVLARGKDLRALLAPVQLELLLNKACVWLDDSISEDKTPSLREYLMKELGVIELDADKFASKLSLDFICKQSDEWMVCLYKFLRSHESLWRKASTSQSEGILRNKPIMRLSDGSHSAPFGTDGKPLVYLPSEAYKMQSFKVIKENIARDPEVKKFFRDLGLIEPDEVEVILKQIIPAYSNPRCLKDDMEREYLAYISKALDKSPRREELKEALSKKPFLLARNYKEEKVFKSPSEIFLGKVYTGNSALETFYEGNPEVWFLDEKYATFKFPDGKPILGMEKLRNLGCKDKIEVAIKRSYYGYVAVSDSYGDHVRGLNGFDPDCKIIGLEYALKRINLEKARIIWDLAKEYSDSIFGTIERSTRQDYSSSEKEDIFSFMGKLLTKYAWIPDYNCNFKKPSELTIDEMHPSLDSKSERALQAAQKLGFKLTEEQKLVEKLPPKKRALFKKIWNLPDEKLIELDGYIEKLRSEDKVIQKNGNLLEEFEEKLKVPGNPPDYPHLVYRGISPEEAEQIQDVEKRELEESFQNGVTIKKSHRIVPEISRPKRDEIKQFLLEQYDGHCQICNQRLDLGAGKPPYFEILHLFDPREIGEDADSAFNVICLCPNCHALAKHGGRDFSEIAKKAINVIEGMAASETVPERNGNFFPMRILLAGRAGMIYYSEPHMSKLCAFYNVDRQKNETVACECENGVRPEEEASRLNDEGVELYDKDDYERALSKFRDAWKRAPSNYSYLYNMCLCLYYWKGSQEAIKEVIDLLGHKPPEKEPWLICSKILSLNDDLASACNEMERLLHIHGLETDLYLSWIRESLEKEKDEDLEKFYQNFSTSKKEVEDEKVLVSGPRLNICPNCKSRMRPIRSNSYDGMQVRYCCPNCGHKEN